LGSPVDAVWGFLGGSETDTAVIDMASAAGLSLVPRGSRRTRSPPALTASASSSSRLSTEARARSSSAAAIPAPTMPEQAWRKRSVRAFSTATAE
jgi:hypothetical protein